MRNIITILLIGLCINNAQSQVDFLGSYGGNWYESNPNILEGFDGNIILSGTTNSFPYDENFQTPGDFYVLKTDTAGELIWDMYEGSLYEPDWLKAGVRTFDGNYLFAGQAPYQGALAPTDSRILKLDEAGDTIYSKLFGLPYNFSVESMCKTLDSNYVLAGIKTWSAIDVPIIVKINEEGDTLWVKSYEQDTIKGFRNIRQNANGDFFAIGINSYPFLIKLSENGNLQFAKYMRGMGEEYQDIQTAYDLAIGNNGKIWVIVDGSFSNLPNSICGNYPSFDFLIEFNTAGEVTRRKDYCTNDSTSYSWRSLTPTSDGGAILGGDGIIQKINADWEEEWTLEIPYSLKNIIEYTDGSYYATGEILVINRTDFFLLKIAADGTNVVEIRAEEEKIVVYPNPVNSILIMETVQPGKTDYCIYDLAGRLMQTGSFVKKKEIDVTKFEEGVYLIQLQSQQGVISKKFVKL
jgi:hypothetical protein